MSAGIVFTEQQRRVLRMAGATKRQIDTLAGDLHLVRLYAEKQPSATDMRPFAKDLLRYTTGEERVLTALIAASTPHSARISAIYAYFVENENAVVTDDFEPPVHPDAVAVLLPDRLRAKKKQDALKKTMEVIAGEGQQLASAQAVAVIDMALQRARDDHQADIPVSAEAGSSFSRIVSLVIGVALGVDDDIDRRRWISAYRQSPAFALRDGREDVQESDSASTINRLFLGRA